MLLEIQALNFPLTNIVRDYVERRIYFVLSGRDEHIQQITVHLSDVNGPGGGKDKCCHIQVVLIRLSDVVIDDTEADLYIAIDRAAERAARTVSRCLAHHIGRSHFSSYVKAELE